MLFSADLHKDFGDVECVAITTMFALQPSSVYSPTFYTPKANCLATDGDTSLSDQILDVAMTEVKAEVTARQRRK